jgi:hypothetical protein
MFREASYELKKDDSLFSFKYENDNSEDDSFSVFTKDFVFNMSDQNRTMPPYLEI